MSLILAGAQSDPIVGEKEGIKIHVTRANINTGEHSTLNKLLQRISILADKPTASVEDALLETEIIEFEKIIQVL